MNKESVSSQHLNILPTKDECVYTSCYCEENVWKLCEYFKTRIDSPGDKVYAVFISNERKTVPIWKQKSSHGGAPVIWDYHVILLNERQQGPNLIYDQDTTLPFPCSFDIYTDEAFHSDEGLKPAYWRKFRVIPGDTYLKMFSSDRSHMKDEVGDWRMPPPSYPCIETAESKMNLNDFISMDSKVGYGHVYSLSQFGKTFGGKD